MIYDTLRKLRKRFCPQRLATQRAIGTVERRGKLMTTRPTLTFPCSHSSQSNRSDAALFVNYWLPRRTLIDHARANTSFFIEMSEFTFVFEATVHILLADAVSPSAFKEYFGHDTTQQQCMIFCPRPLLSPPPFHALNTVKRSFQLVIVYGFLFCQVCLEVMWSPYGNDIYLVFDTVDKLDMKLVG